MSVPSLPAAPAPGRMNVDYEERVDFARLRAYRLDRAKRAMEQAGLGAREIKSRDEITLLATAAAMVDGTYAEIAAALRPGVRENEIVALANKRLYEMGSDDVESINAVSGERCNPHPHNFSDRMIRPGEQAFFDIMHSYNGYRTCYYRCFAVGEASESQKDAYKRAREWMDVAIGAIKPGVTTDQVARLWPAAGDFGLADEKTAFGLQFGHGLGLALTSGRSSPASCRWTRRWRSGKAWCSRSRRTARRPTGDPRRGSKKRSSSARTAWRSSPSSRPGNSTSPTRTE